MLRAGLVLVGGSVITMDAENPTATAVAIAGGRIVAVGDDRSIGDLVSTRCSCGT